MNDEKVSNMQLTPFNKYLLSTYYIYICQALFKEQPVPLRSLQFTGEHRQVIIPMYWIKQPGWYQNTEGGVWTEAGGVKGEEGETAN